MKQIIEDNGGTIVEDITEKVSYILSSDEMAGVWQNPYKMQFFSKFENQVNQGLLFHIPLISGKFVQDCIDQRRIIEFEPYLIFGGEAKQVEAESLLHPKVQDLVKLLFDKTAQQQAILSMNLNPNTISSISQQKILEAYTVLSQLEKEIQLKKSKKNDNTITKRITELSKKFYEKIPHTKQNDIDNDDILKEKTSTLEALTDIEIANRLMNDGAARAGKYHVNPIDINYKKLKTKISPLDHHSKEYGVIVDYVTNGHAKIHDYFKIDLEDVFEIERENENERFEPFKSMKHHRLLWHGSRLVNFIGILSNGLRIAPPEAPVTGHFLGKGVYFADTISKSAEYTHPTKENPYVLLLLCDVALGRSYQTAHPKFLSKDDLEEAGYQSVKGCGEFGPDPAYDQIMDENLIVATGKEVPTEVVRSELKHNEFVVYNTSQVKMRYLVKLKVTSLTGRQVKASSLVDAN